MVRRHEMGQAICFRPYGIGGTHPMVLNIGSPFLLAPHGAAARSKSRAATTMPTSNKTRAVAAPHPDPPPVTTAVRPVRLSGSIIWRHCSFRPSRRVGTGRIRQNSVCTIFDS